jgi:hypothetical protein
VQTEKLSGQYHLLQKQAKINAAVKLLISQRDYYHTNLRHNFCATSTMPLYDD